MPSLEMDGSYKFDDKTIDSKVTKTSPGNYALGYKPDKSFKVCYVGRSDDDVNERLKKEVDEKKSKRYTRFKFSYAKSPKDAFEKECWNCHDFNPPDNDKHPNRPKNTNLRCPVPGCNALD